MQTSYLAPAGASDAELQVDKSRFCCQVRRVETEQDARAVVGAARKLRSGARHHCSAFVLGPESAVQRSSDDGEPSGTAGAPLLEVLTGRGVSDVVAVVTRHFGGVLLGSGGLVRAYSEVLGTALDGAGTVRRELQQLVSVEIGHAAAGRLENDLRSAAVSVHSVDYGAAVTMELGVPVTAAEHLIAQVASLTGGAARTAYAGTRWADAG